MRACHRSTFCRCEPFYGTQKIAADAKSDKPDEVRDEYTDQNTRGLLRCHILPVLELVEGVSAQLGEELCP